jgi:predicted nucleic acid-binding protein
MSQTTEFIRNKSVDNTIVNLIIQNRIQEFTLQQAYDSIHENLPVRKEEIWNSLVRSTNSGIIEIIEGSISNKQKAKFRIPYHIISKIEEQCADLKTFLDESVKDLFSGFINKENFEPYKELLLEVVTSIMAKFGYAYAGQLAGVGNATEFVPLKELKEICTDCIKKYSSKISPEELASSVGNLFDRRDPYLNNLAFSICNRYYISRLIGLDFPIDFIAKNLYENATIFLDTNIIMTIVYAREKRHNEFREILKKADEIGINFAVTEITLAELHKKVQNYQEELDKGAEIIPEDLLTEVKVQIVEKNENGSAEDDFSIENSVHKVRLQDIGVTYVPATKLEDLCTEIELEEIKNELLEFDRKYRPSSPAKNDNALFHDGYHYYLVEKIRKEKEPTSAWFLTLDNSVIEHGIYKKVDQQPPYSIRLFSLLQTLSQFVESQALKGEFADLFGELISKDLLPREQLFSLEDLRLLIGFDIRAKGIPPEFVRKATMHIKKNILKGGELTEKNRSEAIHEFTKFLATPEQNFIEIRKKYDKKLHDKDEDLKLKDKEIKSIKNKVADKDKEITLLAERVAQLEFERAKEKYEIDKQSYINSDWNKEIERLIKIRRRYVTLIVVAFLAFTALFLIEPIGNLLSLEIEIPIWIKYILAVLIFITPFIRSFFEHKQVILSLRIWSKKFKAEYKTKHDSKSNIEYETVHAKPKLEEFTIK